MKELLTILFFLSFSTTVFGQTPAKTVTNQDLTKFKTERVKNDPDDEGERLRLGLPSRAEQETARASEGRELSEFAAKIRRRQAEKESYWQTQIFPVRAEIIAAEAEINYLRAKINDLPAPQNSYIVGYSPYFYQSDCCFNQNYTASQISGSVSLGNNPRISIGINAAQSTARRQTIESVGSTNGNIAFNRSPFPRGVFLVPYAAPSYSNWTRRELLSRLYVLEQTRAGLLARFEIIADEARRDGVKID